LDEQGVGDVALGGHKGAGLFSGRPLGLLLLLLLLLVWVAAHSVKRRILYIVWLASAAATVTEATTAANGDCAWRLLATCVWRTTLCHLLLLRSTLRVLLLLLLFLTLLLLLLLLLRSTLQSLLCSHLALDGCLVALQHEAQGAAPGDHQQTLP
jgi:hypothetical protein